jgi:pyruvate carboxylase
LEKEEGATPISAYLNIENIIRIAKEADVDAIHPGYGFLSESPEFAQACADNGITFVGPTVENLQRFSDKTSARQAAIEAGVPVVPGSDGALRTKEDVVEFVKSIGLPVILKAAMGGGGKGMRVVRHMDDLVASYEAATSEALASFGDGSVFVERFVDRPRHIEIQIVGDGTGNVVHLWERDCSVQRRHQKVIEMAPAWTLPDALRAQLHQYAMQLTSAAKYKNAGTVEFLVDAEMRPYFIEVNPRIQVGYFKSAFHESIHTIHSNPILSNTGRTHSHRGSNWRRFGTSSNSHRCRSYSGRSWFGTGEHSSSWRGYPVSCDGTFLKFGNSVP